MTDKPAVFPAVFTEKRYLGDGAFVKAAGWGHAIVLTTSDGIRDTNSIVLEPEHLDRLELFVNELKREVKAHFENILIG